MASFVTQLACSRCDRTYPGSEVGPCECGSPLLTEYDLEAVRAATGRAEISSRAPDLWRYRELLPVEDPDGAVSLGEGLTPLLPAKRLGERIGMPDLWVKDDGRNPTGTFKARGAAVGIARARELGAGDVCLPTAGNAGGAWAAYGAAAGVRVHVAMPRDAPEANRVEVLAAGADLELVDGLISDAARLVEGWARERGWLDVSALTEPWRVEGKKTLGLELAEQLGWRLPDAIVYPAGGGVGLIGIWRAVEQLRELGWARGDLPRLFAVQSEGCAPIVRAFERGRGEIQPWEGAETLATGLRVPAPIGGPLVLRALRATGGAAIAVPDGEIVDAVGLLATEAGVLAAPEGAATLAGARRLRERGDLGPRDRLVLVNTGTGLKYPEVLRLVAAGRAGAPG